MPTYNRGKLNKLTKLLPEGLLVDAHWLETHGYSRALRHQYVKAGWLEQSVRGVFRRPRDRLRWEQVVISLQALLKFPVVVGGYTALASQGYAHYLSHQPHAIHLQSDERPPSWLTKLPLDLAFVCHNSRRLFKTVPSLRGVTELGQNAQDTHLGGDNSFNDTATLTWGQSDWPMVFSDPERAIFELLDELPDRESFEYANTLFEGLVNLRPSRVQTLLATCHNVKVKRLFLFFAERHAHAWLPRVDVSRVDLGEGNRLLVRGGQLDKKYKITVP